MKMCVNIYLISMFSPFFGFHAFIKYIDFTRIAASNRATDDVTN